MKKRMLVLLASLAAVIPLSGCVFRLSSLSASSSAPRSSSSDPVFSSANGSSSSASSSSSESSSSSDSSFTSSGDSTSSNGGSSSFSSTSSSEPAKRFTITFANWDGSELEKSDWDYGATPSYSGTPTRPADEQNAYVFSGWSPEIVPVSQNATYTAQYASSTNQYTITFLNYDGSELQKSSWDYGSMPSCSITPTKPSGEEKSYAFSGWSPKIVPVVGEATYTAQYKESTNQYTVTFLNYDGTELQKSLWDYGSMPSYSGTPTRFADAQNSYAFAGWSPTLAVVTGDATYTAQYSSSLNQYTVTFLNYDGSELQRSSWDYGSTPSYSGTPTRPADAQFSYDFSGWSPEIAPVAGNATYTAQYSSSTNRYTVTFLNYDGTELQKSVWDYGSTPVYSGQTPTRNKTAQYTYSWKGWDSEITKVTGEATYTACYTESTNQYTVVFLNYDGSQLQKSDWAYGTVPVYSGSTPSKAEDANTIYTFSEWTPKIAAVTGGATYRAVFAEEDKCTKGLVFTLSSDSKSYAVSQYSGTKTTVVIPAEYEGLPVKGIGNRAFNKCTDLTSVKIPNSVTSIADYAFSGCSALTSVTIPNSVTLLGGSVFQGCSALTSATISASVSDIYDSAFSGCSSLSSIAIPTSVKRICSNAFFSCQSLKSVTIPSSVTIIGSQAFRDCHSLNSVTFSSSLQSIDENAFSGCSALTSVTIPSSLTSLGRGAFSNCTALVTFFVDSKNPNYQGIDGIIFSKDGKTLVAYPPGKNESIYVIPKSVTSIGAGAFAGSAALASVTISSSVSSVGAGAFKDCTALRAIKIPSSVTSLGGSAFSGCTSLSSVTISGSFTSIPASTFSDCTSLASISIPDTMLSIGHYAFYCCTSLATLTIPNSVTSIGKEAFYGCLALTSVTIPSSVRTIDYQAFCLCNGLKRIIIPSSVWAMAEKVFYGDNGLAIFCEATSKPFNWKDTWNYEGGAALWYSETERHNYWHYVNGVPTLW